MPFVSKAHQVELERLRFEAAIARGVLDRRNVEIGLSCDRADGGELIARHLDLGDTRIRKRLQPGIVVGAGVTERDELIRARSCVHLRTVRRSCDPGSTLPARRSPRSIAA